MLTPEEEKDFWSAVGGEGTRQKMSAEHHEANTEALASFIEQVPSDLMNSLV